MNIKKTIILFLTPLFLLTSCGPNPEHYDKVILSGKIPGIGELNEITLGKELQNRVEKLYRDCRRNINCIAIVEEIFIRKIFLYMLAI